MTDPDNSTHRSTQPTRDTLMLSAYEDLRRLARAKLSREPGARTIQTIDLVHEVYLRRCHSALRAVDVATRFRSDCAILPRMAWPKPEILTPGDGAVISKRIREVATI